MTDRPEVPRPPGLDNLLAAVAAAMPPCCPADWDEDLDKHEPDCDARLIERLRENRERRRQQP